MDSQRLEELLSEILQRLNYIEFKIQNPNGNIALNRQQSLERYRREYLRANGYPPDTVLPPNPVGEEGEDEID
jgi:hypothetical protein